MARTLDSRPPVQVAEGIVIVPLAPERYKVQFTISRETHEKLRQVQDSLRHSIPSGDPAAIFDRALTMLHQKLSRTKLAATSRPRSGKASATSRYVPPQYGEQSGVGMAADARLRAPSDAAVKPGFSNFTTCGRLLKVGRRALKILSFDAARTMHTRQSSTSGPCLFGRKCPRSIAALNSVRTEFTAFEQLGAAENRGAAFFRPLRCGRRQHKRARRRQRLTRAARSPSQGRRRRPRRVEEP